MAIIIGAVCWGVVIFCVLKEFSNKSKNKKYYDINGGHRNDKKSTD